MAGLTALALGLGRRHRYLRVGWLWYLGTLVPVCGLVQVGWHARADRYGYVPLVGIFLILAWGAAELGRRRPCLVAGVAALVLVGCVAVSRQQVRSWRDSDALWEHALAVTEGNFVAHNNLGYLLMVRGQNTEAAAHFRKALRARPSFNMARVNLGTISIHRGDPDEAVRTFREALDFEPNNPAIYLYLADTLMLRGEKKEAIALIEEALRIDPNYGPAHNELGGIVMNQGNPDGAVAHFREALRQSPEEAMVHYNLGLALLMCGRREEAASSFREAAARQPGEARFRRYHAYALHGLGQTEASRAEYQESLSLDPRWPGTAVEAAWRMATDPDAERRNGLRAVEQGEQVCQATGEGAPKALDALAAAYAEAGRFPEAVAASEKARARAEALGDGDLAGEIKGRLRLYQEGRPFRVPRPAR
jgi:tetratricopeptide (TPR) repeat protein